MKTHRATLRTLFAAGLLTYGASALAAPPASPASELSAPIVALVPVVKQHAAELKLSEEQQTWLREWMASMPAKRMAVEEETVALRARLRELILEGGDMAERESLIKQIGEKEAQLLSMRAKCVDAFRDKLDKEQFAKAVEFYRQGMKAQ